LSATSTAGRIGVWGASGSGKSAYTKQRLAGRKRLIVFDVMDEYMGQGGLCTVKATTLAQVKDAMRANWSGFQIAYIPPAGKEPAALSRLCSLILGAQQPFKDGNSNHILTLAVEEMNTAFPVSGGVERAPMFAEVCSRGRHSGVEVFGLSQRIAEVHTRFRGNCTETVALRQQGPRDVQAAADATGAPKASISALQNLDYLHSKGGEMTTCRITFGKPAKKPGHKRAAK